MTPSARLLTRIVHSATFVLALGGLLLAASAKAEDLRIGVPGLPTSMDPHYHNTQVNLQYVNHVFDPLVGQDANQQTYPRLAVSWKALNDTTWEFKLRQGVKWHDGSPFTADDVIFTFERAPKVPNSPSSFAAYINDKMIKKIDDYTIHIITKDPAPLTPLDLARFAIVSKTKGTDATTQDYNDGKVTVGTGPYRFKEWVQGDRIVLEANRDWWGGKAKWDRIVFKPIPLGPTRIAALLNNDVDVIDNVPTTDVADLQKRANLTVTQGASNRVIFLNVDSFRDVSPEVYGKDGKPLASNPLKKADVRRAMSMAINRTAIQERIMGGLSVPTGQIVPKGFFAYVADLQPVFDPEGAKALLAKAGYPDGFKMTINGPGDRYVNDARITEAIAQMLTRIGIETDVKIHPGTVYFTKGSKYEFSLSLFGNGAHSGGPYELMQGVIHSPDKDRGYGSTNRGRYINAAFDKLFQEAERTVDDAKRLALLVDATKTVITEMGIIPIHHQVNTWAAKKGLRYEPRTDEHTLAESVFKD